MAQHGATWSNMAQVLRSALSHPAHIENLTVRSLWQVACCGGFRRQLLLVRPTWSVFSASGRGVEGPNRPYHGCQGRLRAAVPVVYSRRLI